MIAHVLYKEWTELFLQLLKFDIVTLDLEGVNNLNVKYFKGYKA